MKVFNRAIKLGGTVLNIGGTLVNVLQFDSEDKVLKATGTSVPADASAGYAKGCVFVDTDVATGLPGVYQNIGTSSSCAFVPVGSANVEARTATADGTGTGQISAQATHVTVTSANADHIVTLPAPVVGKQLVINVGATGFELRSSSPTTIAINGGTGSGAESAIAANSTILAICISATAWKAIFLDADSDVAKVEAAA
jgi:hypothetical protein